MKNKFLNPKSLFLVIVMLGIFGLSPYQFKPIRARTKIIFFAIFLLIGVGMYAKSSLAATYYLNPTGSDMNNGSESQPWHSFQKAFDTVAAGDTVNVQPGTYTEEAVTKRSGAEGQPIMIIGPADKSAITTGRWTVKNSWYIFSNLHFNCYDVQVWGTQANHNVFTNNLFTNNTQGIYMRKGDADPSGVNGPSYNTITHNEFTASKGNGSVVTTGTGNVIAYNYFHDLGGWDALRIWGVGTHIYDNLFERIISDQLATDGNHADIIQSFESSTGNWGKDVVFERNKIIDCTSQFGNLENANTDHIQNWTFRNNLFIRSRIQLNNYLPRVKVYNNTVFDVPAENSIGFRFAYSVDNGSADFGEVYNNIFIGDGGFYSINSSTVGSSADYNIISDINGNARSAPNEGVHGINGGFLPLDLFFDIPSGDFKLKYGSVAIDSGKDLSLSGFANDIDGVSRPQGPAWDIGAYEYQSGDSDTTPLAAPSGLIVN